MNRFRINPRSETGAETVEFALVLPLFLLMIFAAIPLMQFFTTSRSLNRLADETAIYATRASDNPERTSDNDACGDLTRRRSYEQVAQYVGAEALGVDVYVQPAGGTPPSMTVSSSADPCLADPGSRIHVRVTGQFSTGPLARGINVVARLVGASSGVVPEQATIATTAAGYLE